MARIAFVQNLAFEYLGTMYLSAMLKQHGHTVEAFVVRDSRQSLDELEAFRPHIVGFSCTTGVHVWALDFARALKERLDCTVVFGGPHATFFPDIVSAGPVDVVCRGEGEHAMLEIAANADRGSRATNLANCWFKQDGVVVRNEVRHLIQNLDGLPFPDRDLYASKYPYLSRSQKSFIGGRGCPFRCSFCFNHAYQKLYRGKGRAVRLRSVGNLIEEIEQVKARQRVRIVYMQDDTFILNKEWLREFAQAYPHRIGLPFVCLIRADLADEESLRLLAEAGCKTAFFGVETGNEGLRGGLLSKRVTDKQIVQTARLLRRFRITFRTYNMLGLPGETMQQAWETVRINQRIATDYPWCSLFCPLPGTELTRYAVEHGMLSPDTEIKNPSFFRESVLRSEHRVELGNLQKLFFYAVRFPSLSPAIRRLIRCRPNALFDFAFLASYAWGYLRSEHLTFREVASAGLRNVRAFFFRRTP